jgi:hypothetical protein
VAWLSFYLSGYSPEEVEPEGEKGPSAEDECERSERPFTLALSTREDYSPWRSSAVRAYTSSGSGEQVADSE